MKNNKTILFVSNILPLFDKDSGSNRLKEIIEGFIENSFTCYFLVDSIFEQEKYYAFFISKGLKIIIKKDNINYIDDLKNIISIDYVWFNGPNSFKKNLNLFRNHLPKSKLIYDMVDIHFLRYKRAIKLNPLVISNYKRYFKYKKIETQLAKKSDLIIAISEKEKETMSKYIESDKIKVISNIHYPKIDIKNVRSFSERNDLLFIGSTHTPNIDAVNYLYKEIMPLVWRENQNIKVNIIGNVNEQIHAIDNPNFRFLGYVENIESYFLSSKFMIAPLRYGAGVKGKIGQAYEYFLPVITTSIGAEGMNLKNNETALIANNAVEFAKNILKLYNDEELWNNLQSNSEKALEPFSRKKLKNTLIDL